MGEMCLVCEEYYPKWGGGGGGELTSIWKGLR